MVEKKITTTVSDLPATIHNYQIIEKLEESNYAEIYRVLDPEKNTRILKIARDKTPGNNELISREFQILSQFQHPNIVSVYDYNVLEDGRAYFTSEYVKGEPINNFFTGLTDEFIAAKIQIINALAAFHNKGYIHSDLKPEHILYNPEDKKAVLIDFGFAGNVAQEIRLAGTIGYMAPEVIKGLGITQGSDLYSLGVIIYEIVAGKKPGEVYEPLSGVSEETNTILNRMLAHEPAVRPTVLELYQTFSKYLPEAEIAIPTYEVKLPEMGYIEISEIAEKLLSSRSKALIVSGDTGSGKTRLLKELKFKYLARGYTVLFYLSGEKTTFHEALRNFVNGKQVDYSKIEDKFQIFEEIMQELLDFAKQKNVVIMVDDLDNLSDYDVKLFRYIGYGIGNSNILLIGASKSDERVNSLGFETITLRPFTTDETEILIEKTFFAIETTKDKKRATQITDFAQWLHKESGGNPLFISEILKTLYDNNVIYYQTTRWQIKVDLLQKIEIPKKIDDLIENRIKNLSDDEMKVLKILSLADYHLEPALISFIITSDANIIIERLKSLGLLREEFLNRRRVVVIPNQILGQIIEKNLEDEERHLLSKSLIKAIEFIIPEDKNYLPVLAKLSDEVGEKEKAYDYFQCAAKYAEAVYDYDAAIQYYKKPAEYSKDLHPDKYGEFLVKIGNLSQTIGNTALALNYYDEASKLYNQDNLPQIYAGIGEVYIAMGKYAEAAGYFSKAMNLMEPTGYYIRTANSLSYALANLSKLDDAESRLKQSESLSNKIGDIKMQADTLYYQATLAWYQNDFVKGIEIIKNLLVFCGKDETLAVYSALGCSLLGSFYLQKNELKEAEKYIDMAIEGFKKIKHINALCTAIGNKASLVLKGGGM